MRLTMAPYCAAIRPLDWVPRFGVIRRRQPAPVVPPQARAFFALIGLPVLDVDRARAPAVFDHESRGRPRVKRCDEVTGVPAERYRNTAFVGERQIVALADVIETEE